MDLTANAEFSLRMAKAALQEDLLGETKWLSDFDGVYEQVKACFDIRDEDLSHLVAAALKNGGMVSKNNRKKYLYRVAGETLDAIETICVSRMTG